MSRKDHLLFMLNTNDYVIKKLLDDITEEESMNRGSGNFNHIRWQAGHIWGGDIYSLSFLGIKDETIAPYRELFGGGSVVSDDAEKYPSMAELRGQLYKSHARVMEAVSAATDADLEKEIGEDDKKQPVWHSLTFMAMHEFYHAGQIVHIRKTLGRPRPFA